MSEQPYDPYIPSGSNTAGATAAEQNGDPKTREIDRVSIPWLLHRACDAAFAFY